MENPYVLLMYVQRSVYKRSFKYVHNLGIATLAAWLETQGYLAKAFTGITTDALEVYEQERANQPILAVGLYCDYDNQTAVEALSCLLSEKYGAQVIVGGPQAIHLGQEFLLKSKCQALIRGDGEETLLELLDDLKSNAMNNMPVSSKGDWSGIEGLVYLDMDGKEHVTPARKQISDLDKMPFAQSTNVLRSSKRYSLSVISARGCPFRCAFCFEGGNTKTLRLRSVHNVMDEIRSGLAENPDVYYVVFLDDTFTISYDRTKEFCHQLFELRKERDFVWFAEGHASLLSRYPDLIKLMADAGMVRMQIGMESGCQPFLDLYKKQTNITEIVKTITSCWENDLPHLAGNFIIGGVNETRETLQQTCDYVTELLKATPGMLNLSSTFVMPLPNTEITKNPEKFGLHLLDAASYTAVEDFPVTETETLSRFAVSEARFTFVKSISDTMKQLFTERKIPRHRIKRDFELARHGIVSSWYKYLYVNDIFTRSYFTLLTTTSAKEMEQIPRQELNAYYPCRTFNLYELVTWKDREPYLQNNRLTMNEYELLKLCGGKLRVSDIFSILSQRSDVISEQVFYNMLKAFQEKYWVLFIPT